MGVLTCDSCWRGSPPALPRATDTAWLPGPVLGLQGKGYRGAVQGPHMPTGTTVSRAGALLQATCPKSTSDNYGRVSRHGDLSSPGRRMWLPLGLRCTISLLFPKERRIWGEKSWVESEDQDGMMTTQLKVCQAWGSLHILSHMNVLHSKICRIERKWGEWSRFSCQIGALIHYYWEYKLIILS